MNTIEVCRLIWQVCGEEKPCAKYSTVGRLSLTSWSVGEGSGDDDDDADDRYFIAIFSGYLAEERALRLLIGSGRILIETHETMKRPGSKTFAVGERVVVPQGFLGAGRKGVVVCVGPNRICTAGTVTVRFSGQNIIVDLQSLIEAQLRRRDDGEEG